MKIKTQAEPPTEREAAERYLDHCAAEIDRRHKEGRNPSRANLHGGAQMLQALADRVEALEREQRKGGNLNDRIARVESQVNRLDIGPARRLPIMHADLKPRASLESVAALLLVTTRLAEFVDNQLDGFADSCDDDDDLAHLRAERGTLRELLDQAAAAVKPAKQEAAAA